MVTPQWEGWNPNLLRWEWALLTSIINCYICRIFYKNKYKGMWKKWNRTGKLYDWRPCVWVLMRWRPGTWVEIDCIRLRDTAKLGKRLMSAVVYFPRSSIAHTEAKKLRIENRLLITATLTSQTPYELLKRVMISISSSLVLYQSAWLRSNFSVSVCH